MLTITKIQTTLKQVYSSISRIDPGQLVYILMELDELNTVNTELSTI